MTDLQTLVAAQVCAIPGLATPLAIPVVVEDHKDLAAEIERGLAKLGVGIVVTTPEFERGDDNITHVITVALEIFENPTLNRGSGGSGLTSLTLAELVAGHLQGFRPDATYAPLQWTGTKLASMAVPTVRTVTFTTQVFLPTLS